MTLWSFELIIWSFYLSYEFLLCSSDTWSFDPMIFWSFELILWFESHAVLFWSFGLCFNTVPSIWVFQCFIPLRWSFKCFSMERKTLFYETWHDNIICGFIVDLLWGSVAWSSTFNCLTTSKYSQTTGNRPLLHWKTKTIILF